MTVIHTIFENGAFWPTEPVNLPEKSKVEIVLSGSPVEDDAKLDAIYQIMGERYHSGQHDLAERHNEHQP